MAASITSASSSSLAPQKWNDPDELLDDDDSSLEDLRSSSWPRLAPHHHGRKTNPRCPPSTPACCPSSCETPTSAAPVSSWSARLGTALTILIPPTTAAAAITNIPDEGHPGGQKGKDEEDPKKACEDEKRSENIDVTITRMMANTAISSSASSSLPASAATQLPSPPLERSPSAGPGSPAAPAATAAAPRPGMPDTARAGSPTTARAGSPTTVRLHSPTTPRAGSPTTARAGSPTTARAGSPTTTTPITPAADRDATSPSTAAGAVASNNLASLMCLSASSVNQTGATAADVPSAAAAAAKATPFAPAATTRIATPTHTASPATCGSAEPWSCCVCLEDYAGYLRNVTCGHGHTFCVGCTSKYFEQCLLDNKRFKCPASFICDQEFPRATVMSFLSPMSSQAVNTSLTEVKEGDCVFRCENPLCPGLIRVDNVEALPGPVSCQLCNQIFLLTNKDLKLFKKIHDKKTLTLEQKLDEFFLARKTKSCPYCHKMIERSEGCPHMSCVCGNSFCWNCGGKYKTSHELLLGGHYSKWNINGCPNLLLPNHKKACKATRRAIFAAKVTVAVTVGPPLAALGLVVVGIPYGVYKGCKRLAENHQNTNRK